MIGAFTKGTARAVRLCLAVFAILLPLHGALAAPCDIKNNTPPFIEHDLANSWCELCGYGYVRIVVSNPYSGASMTGLTVTENLASSGLTYAPTAPNPARYSVNGAPLVNGGVPVVSGANGQILTWTSTEILALGNLGSTPATVTTTPSPSLSP